MSQPDSTVQVKGVALATLDDMRQRIRQKSKLKGRQADDISIDEVRALDWPKTSKRT